ncbi:glcK, partial [Symbiodinium sp. KB8]
VKILPAPFAFGAVTGAPELTGAQKSHSKLAGTVVEVIRKVQVLVPSPFGENWARYYKVEDQRRIEGWLGELRVHCGIKDPSAGETVLCDFQAGGFAEPKFHGKWPCWVSVVSKNPVPLLSAPSRRRATKKTLSPGDFVEAVEELRTVGLAFYRLIDGCWVSRDDSAGFQDSEGQRIATKDHQASRSSKESQVACDLVVRERHKWIYVCNDKDGAQVRTTPTRSQARNANKKLKYRRPACPDTFASRSSLKPCKRARVIVSEKVFLKLGEDKKGWVPATKLNSSVVKMAPLQALEEGAPQPEPGESRDLRPAASRPPSRPPPAPCQERAFVSLIAQSLSISGTGFSVGSLKACNGYGAAPPMPQSDAQSRARLATSHNPFAGPRLQPVPGTAGTWNPADFGMGVGHRVSGGTLGVAFVNTPPSQAFGHTAGDFGLGGMPPPMAGGPMPGPAPAPSGSDFGLAAAADSSNIAFCRNRPVDQLSANHRLFVVASGYAQMCFALHGPTQAGARSLDSEGPRVASFVEHSAGRLQPAPSLSEEHAWGAGPGCGCGGCGGCGGYGYGMQSETCGCNAERRSQRRIIPGVLHRRSDLSPNNNPSSAHSFDSWTCSAPWHPSRASPVQDTLLRDAPSLEPLIRRSGGLTQLTKDILEMLRRAPGGGDSTSSQPGPEALPGEPEELVAQDSALAEQALALEELEDSMQLKWSRDDRDAAYQRLLADGDSRDGDRPGTGWFNVGSAQRRCRLNQMLEAEAMVWLAEQLEVRARQRIEVSVEGNQPILLTAPHNIYLRRDGQPPHMMEEYTTLIAQRMARHLGGTSLSWSRAEQKRSELQWCLARLRCEAEDFSSFLEPCNRDPNYLLNEEVAQNPWFRQMARFADKWRHAKEGHLRPLLHIDVHGCRDPPATPSHLTVGLAAMRHEVEMGRSPLSQSRVESFAAALQNELTLVLGSLDLRPRSEKLVRVLLPTLSGGQSMERLSGAWPLEERRLTQSQQAMAFAGFTHSCQLELSKALRRALSRDDAATARLGRAVTKAWALCCQGSLPSLKSPSDDKEALELMRPRSGGARERKRRGDRRGCPPLRRHQTA